MMVQSIVAARPAARTSTRTQLNSQHGAHAGGVARTGLSARVLGRSAQRFRLTGRQLLVQAAAAQEEAPKEEQPAAEEPEAAAVSSAETPAEIPQPKSSGKAVFKSEFQLNILWQEQFCGVSVDQVLQINNFEESSKHRTPVTEYYFWPKIDAWEELKTSLEAKPWISEGDKILLLNMFTDIVNYWQEVHSREEAMEKFGDKVLFPN